MERREEKKNAGNMLLLLQSQKATFPGKTQLLVHHEQVPGTVFWLQDTWLRVARVILTLPPGTVLSSVGIYGMTSVGSVNRKQLALGEEPNK